MKNRKLRRGFGGALAGILFFTMQIDSGVILATEKNAVEEIAEIDFYDEKVMEYADSTADDDTFIAMDEEGNVTLIPIEELDGLTEADVEKLDELEEATYTVTVMTNGEGEVIAETETLEEAEEIANASIREDANDRLKSARNTRITKAISSTSNAIVILHGYVEFTNYETGATTYSHGSYGPDAAYVGTASNGNILFRQSGVIGSISPSKVTVLSYSSFMSAYGYVSNYTVRDGKLYHNITTNLKNAASAQMVGYQQSYMLNNATYYSYDGHYFYTDYLQMVEDYQRGTFANAINSSSPYYNYYQYLTHRTGTGFSTAQIEAYISSRAPSHSALHGLGDDFVTSFNTYGVNPILMLGVAINESGWGTSSYATKRNNLFGHAAYDSNPDSATDYSSLLESINAHAYSYLSTGYLNPWNWKYFGAHLGNKQSGANVKYASDPYWGEKAASHGYYIEVMSTATYDYNTQKIGIISGDEALYQNADTGYELYTITNGSSDTKEVGVVIVSSLKGETINGSDVWYQIQSDVPLLDDRSKVNGSTGVYKFSRDYVFIHSTKVKVLNYGNTSGETGGTGTVTNKPGDAYADGVIDARDYLIIKNFVMGTERLSVELQKSADVTGDDLLKANDYLKIKDYIMGKISSLN